ncbi:hypothetical protein CoNPh26_CDS0091 [Staphylococcus phage S-CoN_Ph26]|nr:hypothetical protein CoNPh26_CDS0091 [Staphylococcus phage S-CoN_Ph26]
MHINSKLAKTELMASYSRFHTISKAFRKVNSKVFLIII